MSDEGLTITSNGDIAVVTFLETTVLDLSTSEDVRKNLLKLADSPPPPKIIVDFSAVRFLASRMLGVLVELSRRAETGKGKVIITGLHGDVSKIFQITKLSRLLNCAASLDEATSLLGGIES
jgi:anti-anti-sigma factor